MAETCRQVLNGAGVNSDRLALEWASAAEGPRFVELITGYVNRIKALGPLGEGPSEAGEHLERRLDAAVKAAESLKVRTVYGNLAKKFHKAGDYSPEAISAGVREKIYPAFRREMLTQEIISCVSEKPCTLDELAEFAGASAEELEKITAALGKKGILKEDGRGWFLAR